jgi:hypothetical protein
LSAAFLALHGAVPAAWLLSSLLADCLLLYFAQRPGTGGHTRTALGRLGLLKAAAVLLVYGAALPVYTQKAPAFGLISLSLSSLFAFGMLLREEDPGAPVQFAAWALFFGKLPFGPVRPPLEAQAIRPSFSSVGLGVLRVISGLAKQTILVVQLGALADTLAQLSPEKITVASAWLLAVCATFELIFTLFALGDVAVGLGLIFSVRVPEIVGSPLQARGFSDFVYRMNMPLAHVSNRLLGRQDANGYQSAAAAAAAPFLIGLWVLEPVRLWPWAAWLCTAVCLERALLRASARFRYVIAAVTLVLAVPAQLFLHVPPYRILPQLSALAGLGGAALYNSDVLYLATTHLALLAVSLLFCNSIPGGLSRLTFSQLPRLWWLLAWLFGAALLALTLSFMLWNAG